MTLAKWRWPLENTPPMSPRRSPAVTEPGCSCSIDGPVLRVAGYGDGNAYRNRCRLLSSHRTGGARDGRAEHRMSADRIDRPYALSLADVGDKLSVFNGEPMDRRSSPDLDTNLLECATSAYAAGSYDAEGATVVFRSSRKCWRFRALRATWPHHGWSAETMRETRAARALSIRRLESPCQSPGRPAANVFPAQAPMS